MTALCERYTAAWRLFNLQYTCMAPELAMYSVEYLRTAHHNITGDKTIDKLRTNQKAQVRLTAAGIAMLMSDGHNIDLTQYHDCVQIYSDIQQHLIDWKNQCSFQAHVNSFPPLEDLRKFEALAIEVYDTAKRLEPKENVNSRIFDNLVRMNRSRNLAGTNKWLADRAKENDKLRPYISIVDDIEKYIAEIS